MAQRDSRKRGRRRQAGTAAPVATAPTAPPQPTRRPQPRRRPPAQPSRSEARNAAVRATLAPLEPGERPWSLKIAVLIAVLIGGGDLVAVLVDGQFKIGGAHAGAGGVILFSVLMLVCAVGMWQLRYWAVLGFQAILAFVILFFSLLGLRAANLLGGRRLGGRRRSAAAGCSTSSSACSAGSRCRIPGYPGRARDGLEIPLGDASPGPNFGPAGPVDTVLAAAAARTFYSLRRMADASYDCIVIGSGPGGYVAAIRAAQLGMKTAVVEKDEVGGRCLNYACIPAKAVLRVADVLSEIREAGEFGIKVSEPEVDFAGVTARRQKVIKTLTGGVSGLFKKNGIEVIEGEGALAGAGQVTVNGNQIEAKTIILATGSVKRPIPGTQFGGRVIGTEEAWALNELPKTLAVVGAGASGAEIASAYARLGSEMLLYEALDRVLPTEDADISKLVERGLKRQGMSIHTSTFVENIETTESMCRFTHAGEPREVEWLVIADRPRPGRRGPGPRRRRRQARPTTA